MQTNFTYYVTNSLANGQSSILECIKLHYTLQRFGLERPSGMQSYNSGTHNETSNPGGYLYTRNDTQDAQQIQRTYAERYAPSIDNTVRPYCIIYAPSDSGVRTLN